MQGLSRYRTVASFGVLFLLLAGFVAIGWHWIWNFRDPLLLDIDEAGYLRMTVSDLHALQGGGLENWWRAVFWPGPNAPLVPAVTSIVMSIFGTDPRVGMLVQLISAALASVATFGLTLRLTRSHLAALLALTLLLSCQSLITYSRDFHYSVPATAVMITAIWFGTLSNGFRRFGWSIVFGVVLGLLPLSRSMTLAFMPGIVLGFSVGAMANGLGWRQIVNALVALSACAVVMSLWLVPSWQLAVDYLLSFGYGNRAADYGPSSSIFELRSWLVSTQILAYVVYLPHFALLAFGAMGWIAVVLVNFVNRGLLGGLRSIYVSSYFPPLFALVAGVAALTSSSNKGTAFMLPLVPIGFCLLAALVTKVRSRSRYAFVVVIAATSIFSFAPHVTPDSFIARDNTVDVPFLGWTTISSGRGEFERYYSKIIGTTSLAGDPIPPVDRASWKAVISDVGAYLGEQRVPTAFAFRHFLLNSNLLPLKQELDGMPQMTYWMLDPYIAAKTTDGYVKWLTGAAAQACIVLISPGEVGEFMPANDSDAMTAAVVQLKFAKARSWTMPGGRHIDAWQRCNADS